jgi:hypothetical protein
MLNILSVRYDIDVEFVKEDITICFKTTLLCCSNILYLLKKCHSFGIEYFLSVFKSFFDYKTEYIGNMRYKGAYTLESARVFK